MTEEPRIDVEQVMKQIREDILRKRGSGEALILPGHPAPASAGHASADLAALHAHTDIYNVELTSHRPVVGSFIVFLKRILRQLLTPVLARQVAYNDANARLAGQLREEQAQLRAEVLATRTLREQMDALRREQGQLREQVEALGRDQAQLREQDQTVGAQIETLGRDHGQGLRMARERISRAERKLRRILHVLSRDDHEEGDTVRVKHRPALREELEPEFDYLGFEERFRGSEEEIKERQRVYVEYFKRADSVLDIGCGRGEFLQLLKEVGIEARGVDLDLDMVLLCREKGLDVVKADAFSYLESLPDASLHGIFSAQMIEHLDATQIVQLVKLSQRKLRPGGVLILETPNPRCLTVFAESFYMDLSHIRLIHPEAARFLLESTGFDNVELKFSAPVERSMRVPPLPSGAMAGGLDEFNRGVERLNDLLYGFQDYAVIGERVAIPASFGP